MEKEEGKTKIKPLPNKSISMYAATCDSDMYQPGWNSRAYILIQCRAYSDCKRKLYSLWLSTTNPVVLELVLEALTSEICYFLQFILDCSVLPSVIAATQKHGFSVPK